MERETGFEPATLCLGSTLVAVLLSAIRSPRHPFADLIGPARRPGGVRCNCIRLRFEIFGAASVWLRCNRGVRVVRRGCYPPYGGSHSRIVPLPARGLAVPRNIDTRMA